jgi:hypothetical protein
MELERKTYNLTRKLYSDARRLVEGAVINEVNEDALVLKEDLERLKKTLTALKNVKKD